MKRNFKNMFFFENHMMNVYTKQKTEDRENKIELVFPKYYTNQKSNACLFLNENHFWDY